MFIIFDTEYIADKGMLEEGFNGWQNREIIQIAALKVNDNLEVLDSINLYIKPIKHNGISKYFSDLTAITDKTLEESGVDFPQAYDVFKKFAEGCDCYSHGWSFNVGYDADGEVIRETMSHHNIKDDNQPTYKNIAPWFKAKYQENNIDIKKQSSGQIAKFLGVEKNIIQLGLDEHNALYDVYSILEGLRFFKGF